MYQHPAKSAVRLYEIAMHEHFPDDQYLSDRKRKLSIAGI